MRQLHKFMFYGVITGITFLSYWLGWRVTAVTLQCLTVLVALAFVLQIATIAMLFGSCCSKRLYNQYDKENQTTAIHILGEYLKWSAYWSLWTIAVIIWLTLSPSLDLVDIFLNHLVLGISAAHVFWMVLILRELIHNLIEEAQK